MRRGKNGEGRHVRLNTIARKALAQSAERGDGTGAVILNLAGTALMAPRHWFPDAVKKAGIEGFHWHDLRLTFASRLAMAGVPILAIQEALGHKSIAMTVRYSHLAPEYMSDAVEKLVPEIPTEEPCPTDTRTDTDAVVPIAPEVRPSIKSLGPSRWRGGRCA